MAIDLSDSRGDFAIDVVGKKLEEIDVLRLAAEAGSRAATFLKTAFGHDAMMQLIAGQAQVTTIACRPRAGRVLVVLRGEQRSGAAVRHASGALRVELQ